MWDRTTGMAGMPTWIGQFQSYCLLITIFSIVKQNHDFMNCIISFSQNKYEDNGITFISVRSFCHMNLCESFYYKFWVGIIHNENLYTKRNGWKKFKIYTFPPSPPKKTILKNFNFWLLLLVITLEVNLGIIALWWFWHRCTNTSSKLSKIGLFKVITAGLKKSVVGFVLLLIFFHNFAGFLSNLVITEHVDFTLFKYLFNIFFFFICLIHHQVVLRQSHYKGQRPLTTSSPVQDAITRC